MMSINIIPKPSSNNAIYYSSKNNTRLSIPFINNAVNYELTYVQRKICVY